MSDDALTVAVPWSLTHYIPFNGFDPLYRALIEEKPGGISLAAWDNVALYRALKEDPAIRKEIIAAVTKESESLRVRASSKIATKYFANFCPANLALTRLLPGDVEFHHTAPFPSLQRPFVFHCESYAPAFLPVAQQSTKGIRSQDEIRAHYQRIFEDPLCLGIFSHLPETLSDLSACFGSRIVDTKLFQSRIGLCRLRDPRILKGGRGPLSSPWFLFVNATNQNRDDFFPCGGHLVLRFWQLFFTKSRGARLFMRCTKPSDEMLKAHGVDVGWLRGQEQATVVWVEDYLEPGELETLMQSAHFLLLPGMSLYSVWIMQAMRAGAVPIVSNTVGTNRYVVDGEDGVVLNGVLATKGQQGSSCDTLVDRYVRNPNLEDSLVQQLATRVAEVLGQPARYANLQGKAKRKAEVEFCGQRFSEDFWGQVHGLYREFKRNKKQFSPTSSKTYLQRCRVKTSDWTRIFVSVPQPVTRLDTGQGRVTELGGCFIASPANRAMNLHEWSPLAEHLDEEAPRLVFASNIKDLNGCYLGWASTDQSGLASWRLTELVAKWLMPYPWLFSTASRTLKLLRRARKFSRRPATPIVIDPPDIELVEAGILGFNVVRCGTRFFAILQGEGAFDMQRVRDGAYSRVFSGESVQEVRDALERSVQ